MKRTFLVVAVAVATLAATPSLPAADNTPDLQAVTRIRQEGFRNSKVMDYAQSLMDLVGARLTGSPNMRKANEWTRDELAKMGLSNAHLEEWKFGRGWTSDYTSVRMLAPDMQQLYGIAGAWSPGTNGPIRGKVVKVKLESKEDLEANKGKFAGAIVMISEPKEMKPQDTASLDRYTDEELTALGTYEIPGAGDAARRAEYAKRREFRKLLAQFAIDEKIAAIIQPGAGEGGVFRVQGTGTWRDDEPIGVPTVGLAPEQYGRIARLLDKKTDVELEIDVRAKYDENTTQWNTVAELPGTDKKGEVVMLGAHLDSWHTGTGATDNGAGVVA
ncbi:MAG TPA: M28 family peptidase, partial [Thermoanaerobaculia bacterium]